MPRHDSPAGAPRRLSPQVLQVLLSVSQAPMHGYAIIQDVRARTDGQMALTASTLYDALARLLDAGLIRETAPPSDDLDPRRRYYELTAAGRETIAREIGELEALLRSARAAHRPRKGAVR